MLQQVSPSRGIPWCFRAGDRVEDADDAEDTGVPAIMANSLARAGYRTTDKRKEPRERIVLTVLVYYVLCCRRFQSDDWPRSAGWMPVAGVHVRNPDAWRHGFDHLVIAQIDGNVPGIEDQVSALSLTDRNMQEP